MSDARCELQKRRRENERSVGGVAMIGRLGTRVVVGMPYTYHEGRIDYIILRNIRELLRGMMQ